MLVFAFAITVTIFAGLVLGCSSTDSARQPHGGFESPERAIQVGVEAMIALDVEALLASLPPQSERREAEAFVEELDSEEMSRVSRTTIDGVRTNADETLATARVRVLDEAGSVLDEVRMGAIRGDNGWYFGGAIPSRD